MQMKAMKTCFLLMGMLFGWTAAPLFGQDYDVVLNYPMPKTNFRFVVSVDL